MPAFDITVVANMTLNVGVTQGTWVISGDLVYLGATLEAGA